MAAHATVYAATEKRCFLCRPCLNIISRAISEISVDSSEVKSFVVVRHSPDSKDLNTWILWPTPYTYIHTYKDLNTKTEGPTALEAVTRQRLVKLQQTEKTWCML
jgi:hypothetical protein